MTVAGHEIDIITPTDHLSPPSTTSRLSDSDTSECDIDGLNAGRDGASISSLGSSSSPPPEVVAFEQNSVLCVCVCELAILGKDFPNVSYTSFFLSVS